MLACDLASVDLMSALHVFRAILGREVKHFVVCELQVVPDRRSSGNPQTYIIVDASAAATLTIYHAL